MIQYGESAIDREMWRDAGPIAMLTLRELGITGLPAKLQLPIFQVARLAAYHTLRIPTQSRLIGQEVFSELPYATATYAEAEGHPSGEPGYLLGIDMLSLRMPDGSTGEKEK